MLGRRKLSSLFISIFLLLLIVLLPVVFSQIPLGSRLSVESKNHWASANGDFAIRFFNRLNEYGIGIRINSGLIPVEKQPVVWVAGGDLRVGDKSYFELTNNGDLVLLDSTRGVVVWASKTTNSSVASVVLQDDGNLILLNSKKDIVWQSFDTPSDTLLPGQSLSTTLLPCSFSLCFMFHVSCLNSYILCVSCLFCVSIEAYIHIQNEISTFC